MRKRSLLAALVALFALPAHADILIGVAAPLSGRFAEQGSAIRKGVEGAVAAANTSGGLLGEKIGTVAIDDGCDSGTASEAARKLVEQRVAVVIGHPCGSAAVAAAQAYAKSDTLLLSLTRHPTLTDKRSGPSIFRFAGRDDRQGAAIASYITALHAGRRVALVHDRTRYGRELIEAVQRGLSNTPPVLIETIIAGEKDYAQLAQRVTASNAEVLVFGGYAAELAVIQQSLRSSLERITFIGGEAIAGDAMDGKLGEVLFARPRATTLDGKDSQTNSAAMAFDAWVKAASTTGSTNSAAITSWLVEKSSLFDVRGDLIGPSHRMYRFRSGSFAPAD